MANLDKRRLHSEMKEALSCSICYLPYDLERRLPKGFPCQHTVCLECATEICQNHSDGAFPCPNCRESVPVSSQGASGLPTNLGIRDMVEITERNREESEGPNCSRHQSKPITNVCMSCKVGLCARCFSSSAGHDHYNCQVLELDEAFSALKKTCDILTTRGTAVGNMLKEKDSMIQQLIRAMPVACTSKKPRGVFNDRQTFNRNLWFKI